MAPSPLDVVSVRSLRSAPASRPRRDHRIWQQPAAARPGGPLAAGTRRAGFDPYQLELQVDFTGKLLVTVTTSHIMARSLAVQTTSLAAAAATVHRPSGGHRNGAALAWPPGVTVQGKPEGTAAAPCRPTAGHCAAGPRPPANRILVNAAQ